MLVLCLFSPAFRFCFCLFFASQFLINSSLFVEIKFCFRVSAFGSTLQPSHGFDRAQTLTQTKYLAKYKRYTGETLVKRKLTYMKVLS